MRTREGPGAGSSGRDRLERRPEPQPEDDFDDEYDDEYDEDENQEPVTAAEAVRSAARHIAALTGKEVCGVISVERSDAGWLVGVEIVEDRRVPSSSDMLGLYVAEIDADGELLNYRRSRRYKRGSSGDINGGT